MYDPGPITFAITAEPKRWLCRVGWHTPKGVVADALHHPRVFLQCARCDKYGSSFMGCVQERPPYGCCRLCHAPTLSFTEASKLLGYDLAEAIAAERQHYESLPPYDGLGIPLGVITAPNRHVHPSTEVPTK